jgi:peptidoglycan/xylan/chitin deacetylase (PgdA/CDA1 family)
VYWRKHWRKAKLGWKARRWFYSGTPGGFPTACRRFIWFLKTEERVLAILSYHKLGEPSLRGRNSPFYLPESTFVDNLRFLREHGWQVIDAHAFLGGLESPENLPERAALLTFDDAYQSVREVALPWLRRFGFPAITFVATDYIGGRSTFDDGIEPEEQICDWEDLRELERHGVSIQSHGVSHRRFSTIGMAEQEEELIRSKAVLESNLEKRVEIFAFPYGILGAVPKEVSWLVKKAGYRAACLSRGGLCRLPFPDTNRLPRLEMRPDTDLMKELACK